MSYSPDPIDTAAVRLSPALLELAAMGTLKAITVLGHTIHC